MSTFRIGGKRKHHLINKSDKFKIFSKKKTGSDYLVFDDIIHKKLENSLKKDNKIDSFNFINNQNNEQLIKNIEEFFKILNDKNIKLLAFQKEIILNTVLADKRKFEYNNKLHKIESKLIENGTKFSIIDNPTGSGKTLCSLISAIIYSLEEEDNIKNNMQKYFTNKSKWYEINENTKYKNVIFISASQNLVPQWEAEAKKLKEVLSDFILTKYKKNINVIHSPTCKLFKNYYNENSLLILISKNETCDIHKFLYEKDNLNNININEDNLAFPVFIQDESHLYNSQMFNQISEVNYNSKMKKYPAPLASHLIVLSASISKCYNKLFKNSLNTTFNYEFNHLNLINRNDYYYLDKNNNIKFHSNTGYRYYEGINRDFNDCLLNSFIDIKKILPDNELKYMKILKFFESNIIMKNILFLFLNYSDIIDKLLLIFELNFRREDNSIKYRYINELIENFDFNRILSYEYDIFNSNSNDSKKIFNGKLIEKNNLVKHFIMSNNLKKMNNYFKKINNNNSDDIKTFIKEQKEIIKDEYNKENESNLPFWQNFWLKNIDTNKFYFNINDYNNIHSNDFIKRLVNVLDGYYKKNYINKLSSLMKILYLSAHEYNKYFKLALLNCVRCSPNNIISLYKILQDIPITVINMEINSQNDKELLSLENPIENFNSWKERINNLYSINIPQSFYNKEISFKNLVDLAKNQRSEKIKLKNYIETDIRLKKSDKKFQIESIESIIKRIDVGIENWSKNEEECQICYEKININKITNLRLCTNCQNISCSDCLEKWYKRSNSCPNCRGSSKETLYLNNEITADEKYEKEIKIFNNNNINELGEQLCNGSYENKYYINTSILGRLEKIFYYFNKYVEDTNEKLSFLMICRSNDFEYVFDNIMSIFKSEKFIFIKYDNKGTLNKSINKRENYEKEELGKIKILLCYDSENCDTTSGLNFPFIDGIITLGTSSSYEKESQRIGRTLRLSRIELKKTDLLLIKIESNIENNNKKSKSTNIDLINTLSSSSSSNNLSTTSSSSSSSNALITTSPSSLNTNNLRNTSSSTSSSNNFSTTSSSSSSSNALTFPLSSLPRSNYLGGTSSSSSSSNLRDTSFDLPENFLYFDRINGIHNIYKSNNDNDDLSFYFK